MKNMILILLLLFMVGCATPQGNNFVRDMPEVKKNDCVSLITFAKNNPGNKIFIKPSSADVFFVDRKVKAFFEDLYFKSSGAFITVSHSSSLRALTGKEFSLKSLEFWNTCERLGIKHILTYGRSADNRLTVEIYPAGQDIPSNVFIQKIDGVTFSTGPNKVSWENDTMIVKSKEAITEQVSTLIGESMKQFRKQVKEKGGDYCSIAGFIKPSEINDAQFRNAFLRYYKDDCKELKPVVKDWAASEEQLENQVRVITEDGGRRYGLGFILEKEALSGGTGNYVMYYLRTIVYDNSGPTEDLEFLNAFMAQAKASAADPINLL